MREMQRVGPAAVEAGEQPDDGPDDGGDGGPEDPDLERHARAVDHARQDVAAELVDAERMGRRSGPSGLPNASVRVRVLDVRARERRGA